MKDYNTVFRCMFEKMKTCLKVSFFGNIYEVFFDISTFIQKFFAIVELLLKICISIELLYFCMHSTTSPLDTLLIFFTHIFFFFPKDVEDCNVLF